MGKQFTEFSELHSLSHQGFVFLIRIFYGMNRRPFHLRANLKNRKNPFKIIRRQNLRPVSGRLLVELTCIRRKRQHKDGK